MNGKDEIELGADASERLKCKPVGGAPGPYPASGTEKLFKYECTDIPHL